MEYRLTHEITGHRGAGVLRMRRVDTGSSSRTVVLLHGLGSSKDRALRTMYRIAQAGFDIAAIDLFLHGDRPEAALLDLRLSSDYVASVREVIYESAADIPAICAELEIELTQAGILGVSAGGFVAHVMAIQRPQPKAVVAAISSPDWLKIDPSRTPDPGSPIGMLIGAMSPVNHAAEYAPLPLCQLSGELDTTVYPEGSRILYHRLAPLYRERGIEDRLELIVYPDIEHDYTDEMLHRTIDWFDCYL